MTDGATNESSSSSMSKSASPGPSASERPEWVHEPTWDSETGQVKGTDGEWYEVPEPVLLRYLVGMALSTQRGRPPKLVRDQTVENGRTEVVSKDGFMLLLTDALVGEVTRYLEEGSFDALIELIEVAMSVAERRGVTRSELLTMVTDKHNRYGGYHGGRLLMPTPVEE